MGRYLKLSLLVVLALLLAPLTGGVLPAAAAGQAVQAYVQPELWAATGRLDLVVTAQPGQSAVQAVLAAGGQVSADLWLVNGVRAQLDAAHLARLAATRGLRAIVANQPLRAAAGGKPETSISLAYGPAPLDMGVPEVHAAGYSGRGVTVALVDSGVFFDDGLRGLFGSQLRDQFLGQADFASPECVERSGRQEEDHCFTKFTDSVDPYGHGTAVASTLWSPYRDASSGAPYGTAPDARLLSVRVLGPDGTGSYATVIAGIQYVVSHRVQFHVRVLNLSLSASPDVPYTADPLNQAVSAAWASGIVVLAAAGNTGPAAQSITVPGNNPYVITVGAFNSASTFGQPGDDTLPTWSATGPTADGFVKPDVLAPGANIMAFMYADPSGALTPALASQHPDYRVPVSAPLPVDSFFRMNGTSLATGLTSGVVALMLQAQPALTPDQVKARLMVSAQPATTAEGEWLYSPLQQGQGRVWAPTAVLAPLDPALTANTELEPLGGLGPVTRVLSDDGQGWLFCLPALAATPNGDCLALGATALDGHWMTLEVLDAARLTWSGARMTWSGARMTWSGGLTWAGARMTWSGGLTWAGARMTWSGARMTWSGGLTPAAAGPVESSGARNNLGDARMTWSGTLDVTVLQGTAVTATRWVEGD
jgi:serine protease AprX